MPAPLFPPLPALICSCGSSGCGGVIESSLPWCYSQTLALTWGGVEAEVTVRRDRREEKRGEERRELTRGGEGPGVGVSVFL